MPAFEHVLKLLAIGALAATFGGWGLARELRRRGLRWTWASLGFPADLLLAGHEVFVFWPVFWACALACAIGGHWHHLDLTYGADVSRGPASRLRACRHEQLVERLASGYQTCRVV
jgi:hypothetical protein